MICSRRPTSCSTRQAGFRAPSQAAPLSPFSYSFCDRRSAEGKVRATSPGRTTRRAELGRRRCSQGGRRGKVTHKEPDGTTSVGRLAPAFIALLFVALAVGLVVLYRGRDGSPPRA